MLISTTQLAAIAISLGLLCSRILIAGELVLDYDTAVDPALQKQVEAIDEQLRGKLGITTEQAAIGLIDLKTNRVAMIWPDREIYAASVAKIGILLAYFQLHPEAATSLDPTIQ